MNAIPQLGDYSVLSFAESQPQTNNLLNEPNFVSALKILLEQLLPVMMLSNVMPILEQMMENMVQKVVKEQLDLFLEKLTARTNWMSGEETHTPELRNLALKFLDRVHHPVYTGKDIKGEGGNSIRVALVDADGNLVNSGPEASSKVELMVLLDGIDDGDSNSACGESGSCTKSEKKLGGPLLSQKNLKLKEGVGVLDNMKFKNKSRWTKSCGIKLVARTVGNIKGAIVEDAKTESFLVSDCRSTLYKKHYPPLLSDEMWRLREISRNGKLHKRLQDEKINSVEQFLISHNTDPQRLQQRLDISAEKLKVIVDHAKTCQIPVNLHIYSSPGCKRNVAVVFDVVGCVRGLLYEDSGFARIDDLVEDEKVDANKMVISAFENWEDVQPYDNEASTSVFPSQVCNDVNTSICPRLGSPSGSTLEPIETIDKLDLAAISQLMSPSQEWDDFLIENPSPSPEIPFNCLYREHDEHLQSVNPRIESQNVPRINYTISQGSSAHVHSSGKAKGRWKMVIISVKFMAMRKRIEAPEDTRAQKKQRHC